jgi:DNA repair protein RadD
MAVKAASLFSLPKKIHTLSSFSLYDYQLAAHEEVKRLFKEGHKRILLVGPPRIGKGTMIAHSAVEVAKRGGQVLVWIHRRELVYEVQKRLREQFGVSCGLIMAGEPMHPKRHIQLMSVATGIRRVAKLKWLNPRLVIGDEAHRILSNGQLNVLLPQFPDAYVLGFTATPYRNDKKRFDEVFTKLIQITTFAEQIERGVLVPSVVYHPDVAIGLDGVRTRVTSEGMDFDQQQLSEKYSDIEVLEGLYKLWMKRTGGKMQTMCFNVDKKNNKIVTAFFRKMGVNAVCVDEETPQTSTKIDKYGNPVGRREILSKFYKGPFGVDNPIMFLGNIGLFSEGIDCPSVKCVIGNYATLSISKLIQSLARGSGAMFGPDKKWLIDPRTGAPYKSRVIVLDMGSNFVRLGTSLDAYDAFGFSLDGKPKKDREAPVRECPECRAVISINCKTCPECGSVLPIKEKTSAEELKELSSKVDFHVLDVDQVTVKRMLDELKSDETVIRSCPTQWLRINAMVNRRGEPNSYARSILKEKYARKPDDLLRDLRIKKEELEELLDSKNHSKLEKFLENREIRANTHSKFVRFSKSMLNI